MVDNVTIPASGTGTATPVVATDDVGGVHYQRGKLVGGADGVADRLDVTEDVASAGAEHGILSMGIRSDAPASTAGTTGDFVYPLFGANGGQWVNPLGIFKTLDADVTRPANVTAYAVNDALADTTPTAGGFTFTGAGRASGGSGIITDLLVSFDDDAATPLQGELFIYDQAVTAIADNAVFAVSDAEARTTVAQIPFSLSDIGNQGFAHVQNLSIGYTCVGTANLRFLIRVKNVYTPTANSGVIRFRIKVLQVD